VASGRKIDWRAKASAWFLPCASITWIKYNGFTTGFVVSQPSLAPQESPYDIGHGRNCQHEGRLK